MEHIDEFIEMIILIEIALHVHKKKQNMRNVNYQHFPEFSTFK